MNTLSIVPCKLEVVYHSTIHIILTLYTLIVLHPCVYPKNLFGFLHCVFIYTK